MLFISVIICTRKPREGCFNRVLNALRTQTLPKDKWELLLLGVPNNGPFDVSWHPNVRYIPEEGIGLALARMTGISTSNSDLLVFVDDDNVLRADYLENALKISSNYPFLGAWGGKLCSRIRNRTSS
jgi:GT2 family glycosyltransferase